MFSVHKNNTFSSTAYCHMVSPERTKQRSSRLPLNIDIQDLAQKRTEGACPPLFSSHCLTQTALSPHACSVGVSVKHFYQDFFFFTKKRKEEEIILRLVNGLFQLIFIFYIFICVLSFQNREGQTSAASMDEPLLIPAVPPKNNASRLCLSASTQAHSCVLDKSNIPLCHLSQTKWPVYSALRNRRQAQGTEVWFK